MSTLGVLVHILCNTPRRHAIVLTYRDVGTYGRLGNQLFQIASTIGTAMRFGVAWDWPEMISETTVGRLCRLRGKLKAANLQAAHILPERQEGFSENTELPEGIAGVVTLSGYLQSHMYFDSYRNVLSKALRIDSHIIRKIEEEIPEVKDPNTVAVHVRRGDYLNFNDLYNLVPVAYYVEALSSIQNVSFVVVASDDISWCQSNFAKLPYTIIYSHFDDVIYDFALLARASKLVMANSTFSWWAAYFKGLHFGNGTIVAPSPWYNETGSLAVLNTPSFYLPHWRLLRTSSSALVAEVNIQ